MFLRIATRDPWYSRATALQPSSFCLHAVLTGRMMGIVRLMVPPEPEEEEEKTMFAISSWIKQPWAPARQLPAEPAGTCAEMVDEIASYSMGKCAMVSHHPAGFQSVRPAGTLSPSWSPSEDSPSPLPRPAPTVDQAVDESVRLLGHVYTPADARTGLLFNKCSSTLLVVDKTRLWTSLTWLKVNNRVCLIYTCSVSHIIQTRPIQTHICIPLGMNVNDVRYLGDADGG